jgi:hypothetical protein
MLILGIVMTVVGFLFFVWSAGAKSPYVGPWWPIVGLALCVTGIVTVVLKSVVPAVMLLGVWLLFRILVGIAGSSRATKKTMYLTYHTIKGSDEGAALPENEVLYLCMRKRPPFDSMPEEDVRELVETHPDIRSLTKFIIKFESLRRRK